VLRAALLAAILAPLPGTAQELPDAAAVIARYQQAIGGREAFARYNSMQMVGELSVPAQGLVASMNAWAARPNRAAMHISIAGFGEIRSGYTGAVAWSINPMEGPRILQGAELTQAADEAAFESSLRGADLVKAATTVERTALGGRDCLKVRIDWVSGRTSYDCYSEQTGLLIGTMGTQATGMGEIDAVTLLDDYRDFGGILMPARITIQVMGMEQIITVREVSFEELPDSVFEAPVEIRALIR
jgi:hypothetical protein